MNASANSFIRNAQKRRQPTSAFFWMPLLEKRDGRSLDILSERQLQQDRRFKHPRNRRPQLSQGPVDRMLDHILYGIRSVGCEKLPGFVARESGRGIGGCATHGYVQYDLRVLHGP